MYSAGADCKPIVRFWWNLVCNIGLAIGWCTASFVDLGQLLISDFHGVPPLDFLLKFMNDPVKIQLKIQRGDPMKIWNWKLSQIDETRCVSTYDQAIITHQVSSKSHNWFQIGSRAIICRVLVIASFYCSILDLGFVEHGLLIQKSLSVFYTMLTVVVVNLAKEKHILILFLDTVVLIVGQPRRTLIVLVQQMTGKKYQQELQDMVLEGKVQIMLLHR